MDNATASNTELFRVPLQTLLQTGPFWAAFRRLGIVTGIRLLLFRPHTIFVILTAKPCFVMIVLFGKLSKFLILTTDPSTKPLSSDEIHCFSEM